MSGKIHRSPQRRLVAALGAVTLSLLGAVGAASPALADPGNVDPGRSGSIIIHKHEQQSAGGTQSGSADGTSNITTPGVAGVRFTAYKLTDLDLGTSSGWAALPAAVPSTACDGPTLAGHTLGAGVQSGLTGTDGAATISLTAPGAVGAYLVCETTSPSTVVDKAQPFVVTIPYPHNETWLYNVNVYPKNGVTSIAKDVSEQTALGLGATATFPVTTRVPAIADNANYTHYWVQDEMSSLVSPAGVTSVKLGAATLTPTTDYTVTTSGQLVTVAFTQAGLTKLKNGAPADLEVVFTATVTGVGAATDTAYVSAATNVQPAPPVNPDTPPTTPTGTSSTPVTQNWGDLTVSKVDAGSTATGLAGATFAVYAAADPYATDCTSATPAGTPISVNGATSFTTGSGGALTIAGLFVSDSKNDVVNATQRCYVLVETAAPAGFVTPSGAAANTPVAVTTGASVSVDATIANTRVSGVNLPMTGSDGIVVFSIAGGSLVALGLILAVVSRRRRNHAV